MSSIQTEEPMDVQSQIAQLNAEIIEAHNKHYETCPTGLWQPNESPNGNHMYHLYSDGEITSQKGGWAYGQRSVFQWSSPVPGIKKLKFDFPKKHQQVEETYVILTEKECNEFRYQMIELLKKYIDLLQKLNV